MIPGGTGPRHDAVRGALTTNQLVVGGSRGLAALEQRVTQAVADVFHQYALNQRRLNEYWADYQRTVSLA
jgi:UDP-N-acetylglucosamine:LPS N-acetylglucosamine transferase